MGFGGGGGGDGGLTGFGLVLDFLLAVAEQEELVPAGYAVNIYFRAQVLADSRIKAWRVARFIGIEGDGIFAASVGQRQGCEAVHILVK